MINRDGDRLVLSGPLTLDTIRTLYDHGLEAGSDGSLEVDMAAVEAVDSSAVSLMLAWLREARRKQVSLFFTHVPDNLLSLAHLYGVEELLPLGTGASVQS